MQEEAELLQWYIDAGVDEATQDEPRDFFAEALIPSTPAVQAAAQPIPKQALLSTPLPSPAAPSPVTASLAAHIAEAARLAAEAPTLEALKLAVESFEGCAIKKTATRTVFADGNPTSRLMLIGEAPGADEDRQGIPFCGVSGKLLDKMLAAIGCPDRGSYYITNTLFWRPPGNRQPNSDELAMCRPFVEKHIALVDPALIVLVGGTAAKSLLAVEQGITRLRGKRYGYRTPYRDKEYQTHVIYHPAYLLRQPATKRVTWQDLLTIQKELEK